MKMNGAEPGLSFYVIGTDDHDSLVVEADVGGAEVTLRIPAQALPWRDMKLVERDGPRDPYGCGELAGQVGIKRRVKNPHEIVDRTGILGASWLRLEDGMAIAAVAEGGALTIPCLRIAPAARMPAAVEVVRHGRKNPKGSVRIGQLSGGRRVGGITLELGEGARELR